MKVFNAEFVTSAAAGGRADSVPRDGLAHVALAGRSNVGKSSLINALTRKKIARTSAAPGKTRLANIYRVTIQAGPGRSELYLVDLPGYGYARGGAESAQELAAVSEAYFAAVRPGVLLLVDSRHPGLDADRHAFAWLERTGMPPQVVATKVDKLSRSERARNLRELERAFGTPALPVSATSGEGLDALWKLIASHVRTRKHTDSESGTRNETEEQR